MIDSISYPWQHLCLENFSKLFFTPKISSENHQKFTKLFISFILLPVQSHSLPSTSQSNTQSNLSHEDHFIQQQFIPLVKRHCELTEIKNTLEKIFAPGFFLTYYTTGLTLCLYAFRISISPDFTEILFLILAVITQANFVRVQCFFGQALADAIEGVGKGIYESGWEDIEDDRVKKLVMMVMMKSQRSTGLTNWKFSRVDMTRMTMVSWCLISDEILV